ncbi:glycosyltransferase 87 family protein [Sphaerisporangium aureirubrum]|uniref:Glycosyltransferase 87 family protein n=1 Tax=Sphaerisporangium aureirubrum TaxID=1544736 RepID=A0ABW1NU57_9ACTN
MRDVRGGRWWASWAGGVLGVVVAVGPVVRYWLTNPGDQRLVDLDVYRSGGMSLLQGLPVYDMITPAPQLLPFTYPPIAAMLAVPLALMSWPVVQWVWTLGVFLCLGVTVWYSFREALARARPRWAMPLLLALLVAAASLLMPIRDQVRFGQVDILLVMLCVADCLARRPWWPRGLLIGLATAVKLTPGVFLIYLLITGFGRDGLPGQRRAFYMAAFTAALLTILPFLVMPHDAAGFWFSALLDSERLGANNATTNQSIRGMLLRLYLPGWLTAVLWLALVAVVAWYGFRHARRALLAGDRLTAVALTGLMAVLISPVAWIHHLAWVVVVLAALAGPWDGTVRPWRVWTVAGAWIYYVVPIPWWGVSLRAAEIPVLSPVMGRVVQDAFGLGALVLLWLLARRTRRPAGDHGLAAPPGATASDPGHSPVDHISPGNR